MEKVFVYGTLMEGLSNHSLLETSQFVGKATLKGYGLFCVTPYYPGIIPMVDGAVRGEVYDVDEKALKQLDLLENVGTLYSRIQCRCIFEEGSEQSAFTYTWRGDTKENEYVPYDFTPWYPEVLDDVTKGLGKNHFYFFGYGRYCNVRETKKLLLEAEETIDPEIIGVGIYQNHRLAFTRKKCGGYGALDMIPSSGEHVLGVIYRMPKSVLSLLNKKEGYPNCYDRGEIQVICGGRTIVVQAYTVVDKHLNEVAPDPEYYNVVLQGMRDRYPLSFINQYLISHCNEKFSFNKPLLDEQYLYHFKLSHDVKDRSTAYFEQVINQMAVHLGNDNKLVDTISPTPEMFRILVKLTDMHLRDVLDYGHAIPRGLTNRLSEEFERLTGLDMMRIPS